MHQMLSDKHDESEPLVPLCVFTRLQISPKLPCLYFCVLLSHRATEGDCVCARMHKARTPVALGGNLIRFWVANMAVSGVIQFRMGRQLCNSLFG